MNEQMPSFPGFELVEPFRFESQPHEYKVTALRECPTPDQMQDCDTPDKAADYWRRHVASHPYFNPDCECLVVLILNTRRRVKGHYLVSIGTMDTILVHPREVFRLAIMTAASAVVVMHNLCVATHKLCYVERGFMCSGAGRQRTGMGFTMGCERGIIVNTNPLGRRNCV
jgi:RadC-like JAB domain